MSAGAGSARRVPGGLSGGPARPARDRAALGDHLERLSYDAPIRDAQNIGATPLAARIVNVKPSRIVPAGAASRGHRLSLRGLDAHAGAQPSSWASPMRRPSGPRM